MSVSATADDAAGQVTGSVGYAAAPAAGSLLVIAVGTTHSDGSCEDPVMVLAAQPSANTASWACTTPPAKPQNEFDHQDGCLPYTFDPASGAVTIAGHPGTFKDGKLTIDGNGHSATQIPAGGATFNFQQLGHIDWEGLCGLIAGCSVTHRSFSLLADGEFVLSSTP